MAKLGHIGRQRAIEGWLFVSPFIVGFLVFYAGPMLFAAVISLTEWPILASPKFVGLNNFTYMFKDPAFWKSLRITLIYTMVSVPLGLVLGLLLAILLNQKVRAVALFRTLYYVPTVITGAGVAILWWTLLNTEYGLVNTVLRMIGIGKIPWLVHTQWALPSLIIMSLWHIGGGMIIYLAGLQGIPTDMYEAANIDGAGTWTRFRHVTLPMLSPVLLFNLILGMIGSFQSFTNALLMTNGGPSEATLFYVLYLYRNAWLYNRMGYAAALAWFLFALILAVVIIIFRATSTRVFYAGGTQRGGL